LGRYGCRSCPWWHRCVYPSSECRINREWCIPAIGSPNVKPEKTVQLGQPVLSEWLPKGVDLKSSYKVLNSRSNQLKKEVEKITESKTHRVIFHTAWRQPGLDKNQALPIYFKREIPAPPVIEDDEVFTVDTIASLPTQKAEYPGGQVALMKWLNSNIEYPELPAELGIQGRVFIQFVVERNGTISDVKTIGKIPHSHLAREAISKVKKIPGKWKPGEDNGRIVRSYFKLPVMFRLGKK